MCTPHHVWEKLCFVGRPRSSGVISGTAEVRFAPKCFEMPEKMRNGIAHSPSIGLAKIPPTPSGSAESCSKQLAVDVPIIPRGIAHLSSLVALCVLYNIIHTTHTSGDRSNFRNFPDTNRMSWHNIATIWINMAQSSATCEVSGLHRWRTRCLPRILECHPRNPRTAADLIELVALVQSPLTGCGQTSQRVQRPLVVFPRPDDQHATRIKRYQKSLIHQPLLITMLALHKALYLQHIWTPSKTPRLQSCLKANVYNCQKHQEGNPSSWQFHFQFGWREMIWDDMYNDLQYYKCTNQAAATGDAWHADI